MFLNLFLINVQCGIELKNGYTPVENIETETEFNLNSELSYIFIFSNENSPVKIQLKGSQNTSTIERFQKRQQVGWLACRNKCKEMLRKVKY